MSEKLNEKQIAEVLSFMQALQEFTEEYTPEPVVYRPEVSHNLPEDRPALLVFSSDVHFGSIYTDYQKLSEIWNAVMTTDDVYLIINGDFIDNFETPVPKLLLAGINSQLIPPSRQRYFYEKYLDTLSSQGKILAMVFGNHEEFSNLELFRNISLKVPVSANRMELNLNFGNYEVCIALIHKSRFNSYLNPTHSSQRELMLNHPYADIVCTSHTHLPSLMVYPYPKKGEGLTPRILIKTGTLKNSDSYTFKYFNPHQVSHISTPAVLILPQEKKLIPFMNFEDGLRILKMIKGS